VALRDIVHSRYGNSGAWADQLRSGILLHGITQVQLAERAGIHKDHLNRLLCGRRGPTLMMQLLLDEALEQLIEELREDA
jgi:transcriptional regulator with XRE-family HTH domain